MRSKLKQQKIVAEKLMKEHLAELARVYCQKLYKVALKGA